jgi:hypothetical protein
VLHHNRGPKHGYELEKDALAESKAGEGKP